MKSPVSWKITYEVVDTTFAADYSAAVLAAERYMRENYPELQARVVSAEKDEDYTKR